MTPQITDVASAVAAIWELQQRLIYHSQSGRILAGLKFEPNIEKQVIGESDLPCMEPYSVEWIEEINPGAPRSGSSPDKKNTPQSATITVKYLCSFARLDGFIRSNPANHNVPKGMLEWQAAILDAIESTRSTAPEADAALSNSLAKPIQFEFEESEPTELAFQCYLKAIIIPKPFCRRERTSLFVG